MNVSRNKDGPHHLLFCPLLLQPPGWQLAFQPLNVSAPPGPRTKWGGRQPQLCRPGLRSPSSSWVYPPSPPAVHSVPGLRLPPPPTGAAGPTPHGCSLLSTSLELFSQGRHVFSHSRCQPRDSRTLAPGHVAHTLSTSDEDT